MMRTSLRLFAAGSLLLCLTAGVIAETLPLPEPLLPDPEVCASTNGAVTTSTARAATAILLNLLNISLFSYNLEGCTGLVSLCEPYSPALHSAWEPCPGG